MTPYPWQNDFIRAFPFHKCVLSPLDNPTPAPGKLSEMTLNMASAVSLRSGFLLGYHSQARQYYVVLISESEANLTDLQKLIIVIRIVKVGFAEARNSHNTAATLPSSHVDTAASHSSQQVMFPLAALMLVLAEPPPPLLHLVISLPNFLFLMTITSFSLRDLDSILSCQLWMVSE